MEILIPDEPAIEKAAVALLQGLLVAFPTETVYGLGANAQNLPALQRLYAVKGRPGDHPVIVHIASAARLSEWASFVPDQAWLLAEALSPPLTLILPKAQHVLEQVTGGQSSVGLRVPSHPVALALLERFGGGVAAPSANKFGKLSPTSAHDVAENFQPAELSLVLDGGPCEVGIESTIVDFSGDHYRILRPGMILPEQIEAIIGKAGKKLYSLSDHEQDLAPKSQITAIEISVSAPVSPAVAPVPGSLAAAPASPTSPTATPAPPAVPPAPGAPAPSPMPASISRLLPSTPILAPAVTRVPGSLPGHYAPSTPLKLVDAGEFSAALAELLVSGKRFCVLSFQKPRQAGLPWIVCAKVPDQYARQLYRNLRKLDREEAELILVESVPATEPWSGILDRLQRASGSALLPGEPQQPATTNPHT